MSPFDIVKIEMTASRLIITVEGEWDPKRERSETYLLKLSADEIVNMVRQKAAAECARTQVGETNE